jgi:hypothetical protein
MLLHPSENPLTEADLSSSKCQYLHLPTVTANSRLGSRDLEAALRVDKTTCNERAAKDEEDVAKNRAKQLRVHEREPPTPLSLALTEVCTMRISSAQHVQFRPRGKSKGSSLLTTEERRHADNDLDRVPERRVQEAAKRLAKFDGELLGRLAEELRERDDREEREPEAERRVPLELVRDDTERHEHEQGP